MKREMWAWIILLATAWLLGRAIGNVVDAVHERAYEDGVRDAYETLTNLMDNGTDDHREPA
jgi:hypothetical protein